jgi:chromatin segregation and condensation protein Rec8/ScpA/Scc1 (kleisin family)
MRETLADRPHRIAIDERPMRFYVEHVVQRLKTTPSLSLRALVRTFDFDTREALVGSFCALLELVRLEVIDVTQASPRGDIEVHVRAERLAELEDVVRNTRFDEEVLPAAEASPPTVQPPLPLDVDGETSASS